MGNLHLMRAAAELTYTRLEERWFLEARGLFVALEPPPSQEALSGEEKKRKQGEEIGKEKKK